MTATRVPADYFLRQFDRYPEGEPRLAAMAAHSAHLFNSLTKEQAAHKATVESFADRLAKAHPIAALMREVCEDLESRNSDR